MGLITMVGFGQGFYPYKKDECYVRSGYTLNPQVFLNTLVLVIVHLMTE